MESEQVPINDQPTRGGFKKLLISLIFLMVVLAVILVGTLIFVTKSFINKDYLAGKIEESVNSDVTIGSLDYTLLGFPANLELKDVNFTPKKAGDKDYALHIGSVSLSVSLTDLLRKHVDVSSIQVQNAKANILYREDGTNSLEELFNAPEPEVKPKDKKKSAIPRAVVVDEGSSLNAFDQADVVATLREFLIKDSAVSLTIESSGLMMNCENINLSLSSISVDPKQLHKTNSADITMQVDIHLSSEEGVQYGNVYLTGDSNATLFNTETGESEPDLIGRFSLDERSWLNTDIPVVNEAWGKLGKLEKIGIKVSDLPDRATFGRSKSIAAHYHLGRVTVLEPLSIWVGDWEVAVLKDSWADSKSDLHVIEAELLASEKASRSFNKAVMKGLEKVPSSFRQDIADEVLSDLLRDERILFAVKSTGELSDPKVRPSTEVRDYKKMIKKSGRKYLEDNAEDLLKGLLKKL